MKFITNLMFYLIMVVIGLTTINSCKSCDNTYSDNYIDSIKIATIDSVKQTQMIEYINRIDSLQEVINDIQLDIDNFENHCDSVADELLVAQYKLARIEYYNSIATGTNLKYLRGWINRVLKD